MEIIDLTKALRMLKRMNLTVLKVIKIENNVIYFDNGLLLSVTVLVDYYNKEYGK